MRRGSVFLRRQIIADAGNIGQPGLRRLRQRTGQRNGAVGMTTGTVEPARELRVAGREIDDLAKERSDADIRGDVPDADGDFGRRISAKQHLAIRIVDRSELDDPRGALLQWLRHPQRDSITLDQLVERGAPIASTG